MGLAPQPLAYHTIYAVPHKSERCKLAIPNEVVAVAVSNCLRVDLFHLHVLIFVK
jgi:hypothetical protein